MREREIGIEIGAGWWMALLPVILLIVVGLTLLGRQVTPEGGGLLKPADWSLMKEKRAYDKELASLRQGAGKLAGLLNVRPDPVAAGLMADRIQVETLDGHPALALQREALTSASEAVRLWAMGGATREEAESALEAAVALLEGER
jgi:hypothetical protein